MNRKALVLILSAILGFMQFTAVSAQDYVAPAVTISKEKIRMDGKVYYSHIVLEKQTLFSISRTYGVTVHQLYEANANLRETGLKKNSIILIPIFDSEKAAKEIRQEQKEAEKQKKREEKQRKEEEKKNFITHTVKWYEDLDVISEKYGVPVESIMQANDLKGRKLSNRQKLRIPAGKTTEPMTPLTPATETTEEKQDTVIREEEIQEETIAYTSKSDIDVVVMLPFNASRKRKAKVQWTSTAECFLLQRSWVTEG